MAVKIDEHCEEQIINVKDKYHNECEYLAGMSEVMTKKNLL